MKKINKFRCVATNLEFSAIVSTALVWLATTAGAMAQNSVTTSDVVVSATRIDAGMPATSTNRVGGEVFDRLPLATLSEILDIEAGLQTTDLFGGTAGSRATIDLRGYGAPAKSNTLILLNGRRLNDIDLASIDYANIPLKSIDQIEITRGNAGAVLYGDGAVGGVINIITKDPATQKTSYSADVSIGSDVYRETNLSAVRNIGAFSVNAYASYINGEGYRDNNDIIQRNLVAELRHIGDYGDVFVKINLDGQRLGLPGARLVTTTSSLFATDPRGASSPLDFAFQNGIGATTGFTRQIGNNMDLIVDAGVRVKDQDSGFYIASGFPSHVDTVLSTWSFTPRATLDHRILGVDGKSKFGIDFYYSDYDSDRRQRPGNAAQHQYDAEQYSTAIYGQTSVDLRDNLTGVFGARVQLVDFTVGDIFDPNAPGAYGGSKASLNDTEYHYAVNLGVDWEIFDFLSLFARGGRSFRFPTLDERIDAEDTVSFNLKTQTGQEIEGGAQIRLGKVNVTSSFFHSESENEIRFNPRLGGGFGTNSNFDPIRRYGWETTVSTELNDEVSLRLNLALINAEFKSGTFSGKDVPLVSDITAAASLGWRINENIRLDTLVNYVGERWLENDEANTFPKTPDHVLLSIKIGGDIGHLFWSATINNLLDQKYFNYGVASTTTAGRYNTYPQPGRTFFLRAGAKF